MQIKKGDIVELQIEKYAFEGKGIAKVSKSELLGLKSTEPNEKNYVVFVNGSYPGDIVNARLLKIKNSYAEAITLEVISPSKERTQTRCKFFGVCGGCKQQDLSYESQVKYKQQQVVEIFNKLGGFSDFEVETIIPSGNVFYYRNKMEFSFGDRKWLTKSELNIEMIDKDFALGLHIPRIFDKVLDVDECFLQSETSNTILNFTRKYFKDKNTSVYSTKTHVGYLRNLVIKQSQKTNDLMVNLGIPTDITGAAKVIAAGVTRRIDLGMVTASDSTGKIQKKRFFDNNSAIGLEPNVTLTQQKIKWLRGSIRYLVATLMAVAKNPQWNMHLQWDGGKYSGPVTLVTVGNNPLTGGVFYMAPHADPFDGKFNCVYGSVQSRVQILRILPKTMKAGAGNYVEDPSIHEINVTWLKIHSDNPTPLHADGEIQFEATQDIEYQILPSYLPVLMYGEAK